MPIELPKGLVVDHEHPLRVVTFGDSIMSYAELGIRATLERTGDVRVFPAAVPGWGLTPGAHGTVEELAGLFRGLRPELIIGTWSLDAATAMANPARYQSVLDAAIRQWLAPQTGVAGILFLQMPPLEKNAELARPSRRSAGMECGHWSGGQDLSRPRHVSCQWPSPSNWTGSFRIGFHQQDRWRRR